MMSSHFLLEYVKDIRGVGAVAPSSRFLARKMVETIDFSQASLIVEFGPGTGIFTQEIVKRMSSTTKLIVFETNTAFYESLRMRYGHDKRVIISNASAEDVAVVLAEQKMAPPNYVVSGLPFAALPMNVSERILRRTAELLAKDGEFITFQYTLLKRQLFEKYFKTITLKRELRNIPPAYVFHCKVK